MRESVHLLVVDDDELICEMMSDILTSMDYEVTCVQSVEQAKKIFESQSYAGYLLDYRLPDGTGLDLAKHLRDSKVSAPIILISGFADSDVALVAQKVGVNDVVPKPFTIDQLKEIVRKVVPTDQGSKKVVEEVQVKEPTVKKEALGDHVSSLKYLNTALLVAILIVLGVILTILIFKL